MSPLSFNESKESNPLTNTVENPGHSVLTDIHGRPRGPFLRGHVDLNSDEFDEKPTPQRRLARWYFGGLASALAACITHPLDLLKVHLQTAKTSNEVSLIKNTISIVEKQGVSALYNGLSASLFRQLTYSTTRFGLYEVLKQSMADEDSSPAFMQNVLLAGISGAAGGFLGTPGDVINVRMQNDIKLPNDLRRNYQHVFDGLATVRKFEGTSALFSGTTMATSRAILMTIGQLSMYDQFKHALLHKVPGSIFKDNTVTHILASLMAGLTATTLTLPLDVMKTRMMNAPQGTYMNSAHVARSIVAELGPIGFFRGFLPAFVRLAPQTVLTFVFLEKLRLNYGVVIKITQG